MEIKNAVFSKETLDIRNYMEDCVIDLLGPVLENLSSCQCENCALDIMAIALNALPTKYVVTKKGELYTKLSSLQNQSDVDIITAIAKASVVVSRNPRHDR